MSVAKDGRTIRDTPVGHELSKEDEATEPVSGSDTAAAFRPWYGASIQEGGRTAFRLWAPDAERVDLEIEGRDPLPMTAAKGGDFTVETDCEVDSRYRYRVFVDGDGVAIPDPASRALAGGVDGQSLVVDPCGHAWQQPNWQGRAWEETVIYEVHLGACGGIEGLRRRLPSLVELGVTAIELMPIAECPGRRNWGYDGVQPYAVASYYGTPDALKALIDDVHAHGLMIFLDVVYNHFGPDGNFLGHYASAFFREDLQTPWGGAIDFRKPPVRRYFIDNALMWLLDYRFDGLRFDAVHAISERDFLVELGQTIRHWIPRDRHCHLILENEHNQASLLEPALYDAQWADDWHNVMHVLLTGEREGYYADFVASATDKLVTVLGEGFLFQGQRSRKGEPRGEPSGHLPPTAFVDFLQNHDQVGNRALGDRLVHLTPPEALSAATLALLLSPSIPLLFMGEEWGSTRPFLFFTDHRDALADAVREGRRREFAEFSAFEDPAQRERIPDPNAESTFLASCLDDAEAERPANQAVRARYREWLGLRHRHLVPRLAGSRALGARALGDKAVTAVWCLGDGAVLTLALNLSNAVVRLDDPPRSAPLATSRTGNEGALESGELAPLQAAVWLTTASLEPARQGEAQ
ncbi:malto-oligosyltrehalose trehalohydrolase [Salinicola rhizosphaerae]|uniref:Malto-oligosyltrehalose trehalohydrolase n=1 Tax=Salinicola rhizosphaerae TaxID=1443141 RepID=A0ABQ3DWF3_9GAMM|nr:malto-oligosyltrehalose trehalohydrolase [Salinicola rhizosphaerae]GHB15932.1 malto-oligosyltrehalose trehalohydrolase [Salinicola rhizosphaerae]